MTCKALLVIGLILCISGCKKNPPPPPPPPTIYSLTVNSTNPIAGAIILAAPTDNNGVDSGMTTLTLTYSQGTMVTLTATATAGSNMFSGWTGCSIQNGTVCTVIVNSNTTVTANYSLLVSSVTIILPILTDGNCTAVNTCIASVYIMPGPCPSDLAGSEGWDLATLSTGGTTFPEPGTDSVTLINIAPSTQYALDVEAVPTGDLSLYNGPSNCMTVFTPAS